MAFLRLGSTRRVVALLAGVAALLVLVAVAAGAALGGRGEAPPARPLSQAIHDSLTGPKVDGVTARVRFTSNLFGGMTTDQSSALLKGGSGRLWLAPGKLRLELQSDNGDAQIVFNQGNGFVYDGPSDTTYTFSAPQHKAGAKDAHHSGAADSVPTIADIQKRITAAQRHVAIGAPDPKVVGGQPAYEVRVTPKDSGGLVGAAQLAWDAVRGVPLKVAIYARGASAPALELEATDVAYGSVDPNVFALTPPSGSKTVDLTGGSSGSDNTGKHDAGRAGFAANAPSALGSRSKRKLEQSGGGYVVLYGKGLDTIAVFEHPAKPGDKGPAPARGDGEGGPLQLPSVKVGGTNATAVGTPLGGVVSFERNGISYVVAGSQPLSVLEDAAAAL